MKIHFFPVDRKVNLHTTTIEYHNRSKRVKRLKKVTPENVPSETFKAFRRSTMTECERVIIITIVSNVSAANFVSINVHGKIS